MELVRKSELRLCTFCEQAWDQENHFGTKLLHWLTPGHFERSSFDRMNVGKAIAIMSRLTARQVRHLRTRYCGASA